MGKALLAALLFLNVGVPVNALWPFAVLALALLVLVSAQVRPGSRRLWLIGGIFLAGQLAKLLLAPPQWEEGHNLFVPNAANLEAVYRPGLPAPVLKAFLAEYAAANPAIPCNEAARLPWSAPAPCWKDLVVPGKPFAISADGLYQDAGASRLARRLEISAARPLVAGFAFDTRHVWHTSVENPNRSPFSFYVAHRMIPSLEGSTLCWHGSITWEKRGVTEPSGAGRTCRALGAADLGDRLWALQANEARPLELELRPSAAWKARVWLYDALILVSTALLLFVALEPRTLRWQPVAIFAGTLALMALAAPQFFKGPPTLGRDPLLYLSWGRDILLALREGRIADALQGGEPVYVFMPGMRYFRALESLLFGDSGLGHALCMAFLPLVVYRITRQVVARDSLFLALSVLSITMIVKALRTAADGYSDPLGLLLIGIAALGFMGRAPQLLGPAADRRPDGGIALAFLVLAVSVVVRPNYALAAAFLATVWIALRARRALLSPVVLECAPLLLVLLVPLHNAVFGHRFVPMTLASTLPDALTAPPSAYLGALGELLRFAPAENVHLLARQLSGWWLPFKWILFARPLAVALAPRFASAPLRLLAGIAFALQVPHLFYRSGAREMMAANYLALIVVLGLLWQFWERRAAVQAAKVAA